MADFGFLQGLPAQIGNFLQSSTGRQGALADIARQQLQPNEPPVLPSVSGEESQAASNLRSQLIPKGESGESKEQKGQMMFKVPRPDGSILTIKLDMPVPQQPLGQDNQQMDLQALLMQLLGQQQNLGAFIQ